MGTSTNEAQPTIENKMQPTSNSATANVAHPSIVGKTNVFSATYMNGAWIIDTSASD